MTRSGWIFLLSAIAIIAVIVSDNFWINIAATSFLIWVFIDLILNHGRME